MDALPYFVPEWKRPLPDGLIGRLDRSSMVALADHYEEAARCLRAHAAVLASQERRRRQVQAEADHRRKNRPWTPKEQRQAQATARAALVARLAAKGLTNDEIGAKARLHPGSVSRILKKIFRSGPSDAGAASSSSSPSP